MQHYLTTAINYTNGSPHMGHAYEIICADILARFYRFYGKDVYFATGTDEHGQKIAQTATTINVKPIDICNKYAQMFQSMNQQLGITNDIFVRTTSQTHIATAKAVWQIVNDNGDIYLGDYSGWYNIREEQFVSESDAQKDGYLDSVSKKPLVKYSCQSYFFRLSKYQDKIIAHINNNSDFILPAERREEILGRLSEPLTDLSISRHTSVTDWGISIDNTDHVMYVWFDALTNYLSAIDYFNTNTDSDTDKKMFWPASTHIIGKDIVWFHAVIWPAMLLSAGIALPKTILAHGFINGPDGRKMSKSLGNVIDPVETMTTHYPDVLRIYLTSKTNIGADFNMDLTELINFHDHVLIGKFSNLVNRALVLTTKVSDSVIPNTDAVELFSTNMLSSIISTHLDLYKTRDICTEIFNRLDLINTFVTETKPWTMIPAIYNNVEISHLCVIKTVLESIYILSHYLCPFMPAICNKVFVFMNTLPKLSASVVGWNNLVGGTRIGDYHILFKQIQETKEMKRRKIAAPTTILPTTPTLPPTTPTPTITTPITPTLPTPTVHTTNIIDQQKN